MDIAQQIKELKSMAASLRSEYDQLIYPCWEGVGAHREDDLEKLMKMIDALPSDLPAPAPEKPDPSDR